MYASAVQSALANVSGAPLIRKGLRAPVIPTHALHSDAVFHIVMGIARSETAIATPSDVAWFVSLSGVCKSWSDLFHSNSKKHALWSALAVNITNRLRCWRRSVVGGGVPTDSSLYRNQHITSRLPLSLVAALSGCSGEPALFFQFRVWPLLKARHELIDSLLARGVPLNADPTLSPGVSQAITDLTARSANNKRTAATASAQLIGGSGGTGSGADRYVMDSDLWVGARLGMFDHIQLKVGGTKFGGRPELPTTSAAVKNGLSEWRSDYGQFIGQLNLSDFRDSVSTIGLLPASGVLYFFMRLAAKRGEQHKATVLFFDPTKDPDAIAAIEAAAESKNTRKPPPPAATAATAAPAPNTKPTRSADAALNDSDDLESSRDGLNTSGSFALDPVLYPPLPTRSVLDDPSDDEEEDLLAGITGATAAASGGGGDTKSALAATVRPGGAGVIEPWTHLLRAVPPPQDVQQTIKTDTVYAILPASDMMFLSPSSLRVPQPLPPAPGVGAAPPLPALTHSDINPAVNPTVIRARQIMRESLREPIDSDVVVLGPPNLLGGSADRNPLLNGTDRVLLLQYNWSVWGGAAVAFYFSLEREDLLAGRFDRVSADLAVAS